jgi:hypothetical protein
MPYRQYENIVGNLWMVWLLMTYDVGCSDALPATNKCWSSSSSSSMHLTPPPTTTTYYNYLAIGSNMVPSTMMSLRNLEPLSATAAILPNYELTFIDLGGGGGGSRWMEPSAASVVRRAQKLVHGVLYTLTEDDFAKLGQSEGVPFVYRWERCVVIPYIGDGKNAGRGALAAAASAAVTTAGESVLTGTAAFVLTASPVSVNPKPLKFIPPSQSYLKILQDGIQYWKMDQAYQNEVANVPVDRWVPGISGVLLQYAERWNPKTNLPMA